MCGLKGDYQVRRKAPSFRAGRMSTFFLRPSAESPTNMRPTESHSLGKQGGAATTPPYGA